MKVAILGFGVVGQAVARLVHSKHADRLAVTHVFNRHVASKRDGLGDNASLPAGVVWTEDIDEVLSSGAEVIVELLGGVTPAATYIRQALESGASVVTANKQVVARHGPELLAVACARGVEFRFEGSVAGGIPVLRAIEDGLCGDSLTRVAGVVNGTSTHILSRMEAGETFAGALAGAQALGFAEADPSDDLTGRDAAAKLAILTATALGRPVHCSDISCRSIETIEAVDFRYARELGCTIRQVAWAETGATRGQVIAAVRPALVSHRSPLAGVTGNQNVVTVVGEFGGETAFFGRGAGGEATAVAVVSDILAIAGARDRARRAPRRAFAAGGSPGNSVTSDFVAPHYIRFVVRDRPGIIAAVSSVFARYRVSINAVLQHPGWPASELPFVMTLEACGESCLDRAMTEIGAMDFHVKPPIVLPIFGASRGAV